MEDISWWIIGLVGIIFGYFLGQQVRKSKYNELKELSNAQQRIIDNNPIVHYVYTIYFSYRYDRGATMVDTVTDYGTVTMTIPYDIAVVGATYQPLLDYIANATRKGNPQIIHFEKKK
jgi:hypothetical protein